MLEQFCVLVQYKVDGLFLPVLHAVVWLGRYNMCVVSRKTTLSTLATSPCQHLSHVPREECEGSVINWELCCLMVCTDITEYLGVVLDYHKQSSYRPPTPDLEAPAQLVHCTLSPELLPRTRPRNLLARTFS